MRGLIVVTVLLLASCSSSEDIGDASATEDASAGTDASAAIDASATDAGSRDAGSSSSDAGSSDAGRRPDAGATIPDAGRRRDAGRPGSLCAAGPCTPTCLRPYVCVTECGGAETNCGCCPCAANAIDTIDCPGT